MKKAQKIFGGKIYHKHGQNMTKPMAQKYASSWRRNKPIRSVHVVKEGKKYSLYIRRPK